MAKIYYYYGAMGSSKSMQLLATAHNYESQGKRILCFKPQLDDRDEDIKTRAGMSRPADVILEQNDSNITRHVKMNGYLSLDAILLDECQFFTRDQVLGFVEVADLIGVPIIAYGLKTDFQGNLFDGAKTWLEYADSIKEIKTVCYYCNSKATMNLRLFNNIPMFDGKQIATGDITEQDSMSYKPVCRKCYMRAKEGIILRRKKG